MCRIRTAGKAHLPSLACTSSARKFGNSNFSNNDQGMERNTAMAQEDERKSNPDVEPGMISYGWSSRSVDLTASYLEKSAPESTHECPDDLVFPS
jgi:hypothetical protein